MGIIKNEDVLAVRVGEELFCRKCVSNEDWNDATEEDFYTEDEAEKKEMILFCDGCKKKIYG